MSYLLRTEDDYRLCYGEPVKGYVRTNNGSLFCAEMFEEMISEEREISAYREMEKENFRIDEWADVAENNHGIVIPKLAAEYLLGDAILEVDEWIEICSPLPPVMKQGK